MNHLKEINCVICYPHRSLAHNIRFDHYMKPNQITKEHFIRVVPLLAVSLIDPMLEHLVKCLMMKAYWNEEHQKCETFTGINITKNSNRSCFAQVTVQSCLVPWQSNAQKNQNRILLISPERFSKSLTWNSLNERHDPRWCIHRWTNNNWPNRLTRRHCSKSRKQPICRPMAKSIHSNYLLESWIQCTRPFCLLKMKDYKLKNRNNMLWFTYWPHKWLKVG